MSRVHDYSTELEFALKAARLGGRIALSHFGRDPRREQKADGTFVTEADWAVEAQIRLRIARTFPDHNILGEEEGLTAAGGGPPNPNSPTWVVDPIDGTNNYIDGIPIWGTLIGLRIDERSVVGVCHAPALAETYDAALGLGARLNGSSITVDLIERLEDAVFLYGGAEHLHASGWSGFFDEIVGRVRRTRGLGDFWGHVLVARGAAHVMVEPLLKPWDVVALQPIIEEAGGRLTRANGGVWTEGGSCLTTCGTLHDEVVSLVRKTVPDWVEL
ncbi:MAG: inositol monophosphatase [Actinomycetota bacterium]